MKVLLSLLCLSVTLNAFATESSSCREHRNDVLRKAVSLNPEKKTKAEWMFEKGETEALKFIEAFDPKKLEIKENMEKFKQDIAACDDKVPNKIDYGYCQSVFDTNTFVQALALAIKQYEWSESTKQAALNKLKSFVHETIPQDTQVIYKVTAGNLVQTLSDQGLLKLNAKRLRDLQKNLEKRNLRLTHFKPDTCGQDRLKLRQELQVSAEFENKFKTLMKGTPFQL